MNDNKLPIVQLTIVEDRHLYVSVTIDKQDFELGRYDTVLECAEVMNRWIGGRGYVWAPDTAHRLAEAKRTDPAVLVLDAWPKANYEAYRAQRDEDLRQVRIVLYDDDTAHIRYRMGTRDEFPWLNTAPY